ncbi:MAG: hypothetical protein A2Y37_06875 [Spirochaetes bacterium GWB1_60_80]|nr:MAG: hypothetical protein A2Y37_06875 [Spirochaetes bacterium GWB1_60_80]OHD46297.1 MAG: hypothetical protein A2Y35_07150 [Spirochaetes bacterium GWE1_60_18]
MVRTRYEMILDASHDFITLVDRDYIYSYVNEPYCREMGSRRQEILGKTVSELWGEEKFQGRIKAHLDECFAGQESHDIDRFEFGSEFRYIHVSYYPYKTGDAITHAMVYSHDITAIKELESKILDYEFKDRTTGLFNRKSFNMVLELELEKARRSESDKVRALLFINLRNMGQINTRFGAHVGDLLLESTAIKVKEALRMSDYVFRFEGKQLVVLLTTMKRETDITLVAENIREKTTFPYNFKDEAIYIGCNVGAAVFPFDGQTAEELVTSAMSAATEASERDLPIVVFNRDLYHRAVRKNKLKADVRRALVEEQFSQVFQPIIDVATGGIVGAEALIRWQHRELGLVSPTEFIPLAEESGDTGMIGRWNLFRVCRYLRAWDGFLGDRYISINFSSREFSDPGLVEFIASVLASHAVAPQRVKLEITETRTMEDMEEAVAKIRRLAELGVEVLIDDFGAGFSSLAYLKRLPARIVKIDKVFVDHVEDEVCDRLFLAGMIAMIQSYGKTVVVEGVETPGQVRILRELGVSRIQGFHYSRPLAPEAFERLLRANASLP